MAESFELPEKPEDRKERTIGLIIAAIAVVLAIVSSAAHDTQNEQIITHVDAADQYAFYQAKKERHEQLQLSTDNLVLRGQMYPAEKPSSDQLSDKYAAEMKKLDSDATEIHAKGDDLLAESVRLQHKGSVLDIGEIALQISVVLCSISILTEQLLFVRMGVGRRDSRCPLRGLGRLPSALAGAWKRSRSTAASGSPRSVTPPYAR